MKHVKLGASIALAVSVSMVAACQIGGAPSQPAATGETTISQGGSVGKTTLPKSDGDTTLRQAGDATLTGKVLDGKGNPVAGALVVAGDSRTKTGADGSYSLKVTSGELVNVKVIKDGYILRDSSIPIAKGESLELTASLVKADDKVTRIAAAEGGKAVSSDGEVELIFPAGALAGDTNVRVTWLDPQEGANKPAAFRIKALEDTANQGGETDPADDTPPPPAGPVVAELNTSELPGPLETQAYGDKKYFSPVSFADVTMDSPLKEGETATLRMAISQEVLDDMIRQGDLKDSDLGQEIFPCFSWSADASTWDKPALSKVVKDENGKYWFEYSVRANNMDASGGTAQYQHLAIGDEDGFAQVTLVVGGGRRVVDGTYTYGALIERSSDSAYDFKGVATTLQGGRDWTNTGGHYRSPDRTNIVRPNVATDSYSGTYYASVMGADEFSKWDRNGAFRLQFPPGVRFEIDSPSYFGFSVGRRTGRTNTAAQAYLTPDPTGQSSAQQTQSIVSTYVQPFYYNTDANLTLTFKENGASIGDKDISVKYAWRGADVDKTLQVRGGAVTLTLPRNANGTAQTFTLKAVSGGFFLKEGTQPSKAGISPASSHSLAVDVTQAAAK